MEEEITKAINGEQTEPQKDVTPEEEAVPEEEIITRDDGFQVIKHNQPGGPTCPIGAQVKVHYTGYLLNGTVFDSSVQRNEPFSFVLGSGRVIKCWDQGIAMLQKGQRAKLTCPPSYAYGKRGAGSDIPPNATIFFDVEVLDWL